MGVIPRVILVGQAYEDVNDPKNVLGTYYSPDDTGICYYGNTCVKDAWLVDFDWDGLPDLPWGRIVANTLTKVQYSVQTFLDVLNHSHVSSPKAFLLDGDLSMSCQVLAEPAATMQTIRQLYTNHGIPTTLVKDSQFADCYDLAARQNSAISAIQNNPNGITELAGAGYLSDRRRSPALLIQNWGTPYWTMNLVTRQQRLVAWFPGCDFGDGDRINTGNTSIVEMFTTANPSGTTAAFWTSHGRGAWGRAHLRLAKETMEWRFSHLCYDTYEVVFRAIRALGQTQPGLVDYLSTVHNYGWPVALSDFPDWPGGVPTSVDDDIDAKTTNWLPNSPNPFTEETRLWYSLAKPGNVTIDIVDASGRLVTRLTNERQTAGPHSAIWRGVDSNGRRVASGVYFANVTHNSQTHASRLILLR